MIFVCMSTFENCYLDRYFIVESRSRKIVKVVRLIAILLLHTLVLHFKNDFLLGYESRDFSFMFRIYILDLFLLKASGANLVSMRRL